jgi:hypothetical protein
MRPTFMCLCGLLIFVTVTMSGCGEEDPGPEATQVDTITIDALPNGIAAPWEIVGPAGFSQSGTGSLSLPDMAAGSYTLTWGAVPDWTTPSPAEVTRSLAVDGTLTFTGVYIDDTGAPPGGFAIRASLDGEPWVGTQHLLAVFTVMGETIWVQLTGDDDEGDGAGNHTYISMSAICNTFSGSYPFTFDGSSIFTGGVAGYRLWTITSSTLTISRNDGTACEGSFAFEAVEPLFPANSHQVSGTFVLPVGGAK